MLLLPTPVQQTALGYLTELCKRSRSVPQIMTFVFPAFTLKLSKIWKTSVFKFLPALSSAHNLADSLDPDQARQDAGSDLISYWFAL